MENLIIRRKTYKRVQTVCTVKINQAYINDLNRDIASRITNPENFVPLTLEEIAQAIYKNERQIEESEPDSRLIKELDFRVFEKNFKYTYQLSLFQYIRSYINGDLYEYEDIEDEEVDNTVDEVIESESESELEPGSELELGSKLIYVHLND